MTRLLGTGLLLVLTLLAAPWPAMAHEVRPALLQLTEVEADRFTLLWRLPAGVSRPTAARGSSFCWPRSLSRST